MSTLAAPSLSSPWTDTGPGPVYPEPRMGREVREVFKMSTRDFVTVQWGTSGLSLSYRKPGRIIPAVIVRVGGDVAGSWGRGRQRSRGTREEAQGGEDTPGVGKRGPGRVVGGGTGDPEV